MISVKTCRAINTLGLDGKWMEAAALILPESEWHTILDKDDAKEKVTIFFYGLLHARLFEHAAAVAWSEDLFSLKAASARRLWELYQEERQVLVMGGAGVGKSYTDSGICLLDWSCDPENTLVRILSVTRGHSKTNMFAQFQNLHRNSLIQLPGEVTAQKISVDSTSDRHGIHVVAIPAGDAGIGKLRGLHPSPRTKPHPIFGKLTRVRLLLDEAGEIPEGVWREIPNLLVTLGSGNIENIKVLGFSNPEDADSEYGQRCTYPGGWPAYDHEMGEQEWLSDRGWKIFRIDPARTENVVQREEVCPGMQTYEGYQQAIKESGGINSAGYWIMCRGIFPPKGHEASVIPADIIERSRGEWLFLGPAINLMSVDSALQGGDATQVTFARYGKATHAKFGSKIEKVWANPRFVIQLDHQIQCPKGDSVQVARNIIKEVPRGQQAEWIAVDGTGTGDGVAAILKDSLGDVLIIVYGRVPSDEPVFTDDELKASEAYTNIAAEMWWSMRKWLEHRLCLIGHACGNELFKQLKGRRGKQAGRKWKVEGKDDYKKRFKGKSPDNADSAIQIVHLVRMRGDMAAGIFSDTPVNAWRPGDFIGDTDYGNAWHTTDISKD